MEHGVESMPEILWTHCNKSPPKREEMNHINSFHPAEAVPQLLLGGGGMHASLDPTPSLLFPHLILSACLVFAAIS